MDIMYEYLLHIIINKMLSIIKNNNNKLKILYILYII